MTSIHATMFDTEQAFLTDQCPLGQPDEQPDSDKTNVQLSPNPRLVANHILQKRKRRTLQTPEPSLPARKSPRLVIKASLSCSPPPPPPPSLASSPSSVASTPSSPPPPSRPRHPATPQQIQHSHAVLTSLVGAATETFTPVETPSQRAARLAAIYEALPPVTRAPEVPETAEQREEKLKRLFPRSYEPLGDGVDAHDRGYRMLQEAMQIQARGSLKVRRKKVVVVEDDNDGDFEVGGNGDDADE
ncbi:hypothetical protein EDC01DRAFT_633550 [Geopyxis carbonaria]|nr:hypothetical protein EDC01DRAFT_633550 [Geopyxis carbonaria]